MPLIQKFDLKQTKTTKYSTTKQKLESSFKFNQHISKTGKSTGNSLSTVSSKDSMKDTSLNLIILSFRNRHCLLICFHFVSAIIVTWLLRFLRFDFFLFLCRSSFTENSLPSCRTSALSKVNISFFLTKAAGMVCH